MLLALSVLVLSCKQNNSINCTTALCTLELRTITTKVKSNSKDTVLLDSYYTVNTNLNDTIFPGNWQGSAYAGVYNVLSDGYVDKMRNKTYQFSFIGIINNTVVVNEPYTISADCCHISLVSGRSEITID